MSLALEKSLAELSSWTAVVNNYERIFTDSLKKSKVRFTINGEKRIPGILNISFDDILGQDLVLALDMRGYAISGGSACSSGSVKPSSTLKEIGMSDDMAMRTVRISFGKNLSKKNIIGLAETICDIINNQFQNTQ